MDRSPEPGTLYDTDCFTWTQQQAEPIRAGRLADADGEPGQYDQRERLNIEVLLDDNPGLVPKRQTLFEQAYWIARREAAIETELRLEAFPLASPVVLEKVERATYWPSRAV